MKKNTIVAVTFLDHVKGGSEPMRFTLYGRVVTFGNRAIEIGSWVHSNQRKKCDHNCETYTILRSCIEEIVELVPA